MAKSVGIVSDIKGLVTLDIDNTQQELKMRDPITENGALLTTSELSNITIAFDDGREVTIGANQQVSLDNSFFENEAYANDEITFSQDSVNQISENQTYDSPENIQTTNDQYNGATDSSGDVNSEQLDREFTNETIQTLESTIDESTNNTNPTQVNRDATAETDSLDITESTEETKTTKSTEDVTETAATENTQTTDIENKELTGDTAENIETEKTEITETTESEEAAETETTEPETAETTEETSRKRVCKISSSGKFKQRDSFSA